MSTFHFDTNRFGDLMLGRSDIYFDKDDKKNHGWTQRDGMAMHYRPHAHTDYYYRTWRHQVSLCRASAAILVSCKIDQRRSDVHKDDHLILLASVARDTTTLTVQAAAQSIHEGVSGQTEIIVHKKGVDTGDALKAAITRCIDKMMKDAHKGSDGGYSYMAEIAKTNLQCLAASCVVK